MIRMRRRAYTRAPSMLVLLWVRVRVLWMVLCMLVPRRFLRRRHKIRRERKCIRQVERNHIHLIVFVRFAEYIIDIVIVGWGL